MTKRKTLLSAMLIMMGFCGYAHLLGGAVRAVRYHELSQINPYNLIRINGLVGHAGQTWWGFAFGWLVFAAGIAGIYIFISRERS